MQITVAIDARVPDIGLGGVQQVIRTLATSFDESNAGDIKRVWIVYRNSNWWRNLFPIGDRIIQVNPPFGRISMFVSRISPQIISLLFPFYRLILRERPTFDQTLAEYGVDFVHLPFQDGLETNFPTIYHPHDFQHVYFPSYFNWVQLYHRNNQWKRKAVNATIVMAASEIVKEDIIQNWGIPSSKIRVEPIPPPQRILTPRSDWHFHDADYIVYPAVFWKHKNHANLVKALAILNDSGTPTTCFFAGASGPELKSIVRLVDKLEITNNIIFLGHVPDKDYGELINGARLLVIPSVFEAHSLTIWEAQMFNVPIVCSDIPMFRNQVVENASFFDPEEPSSIAFAIFSALQSHGARERVKQETYAFSSSQARRRFAEGINGIYRELKQELS
jgi:glycosyltransferase involved in cell wall biosynthesis